MTWARIVELLLELLEQLTQYLQGIKRTKESQEAQIETDKINTDPISSFNEHFSGVRAQEALHSNGTDSNTTDDKSKLN